MAIDDLLGEDGPNTRLHNWFRRHGLSIVIGVAIGLALITARFYWVAHQRSIDQSAFAQYERVVDRIESKAFDRARAEMAALSSAHAPVLLKLAAMQLAKAFVAQGRLSDAIVVLNTLPPSEDALDRVVRQRLAHLWIATKKPEQAIAALAGRYDSISQEIRGDAYAAMGQLKNARQAYGAALKQVELSTPQFTILNAKRDAVGEPSQTALEHTP